MRTACLVGVLCMLPLAAGAADFLLVPESTTDQVLLIDESIGALVDANYLDIATPAAAAGTSSTPIEALVVGSEIWVSDQLADRIWRFDHSGGYLGDIGADQLNNIRGMEYVGNTVYVAMGSSSDTLEEGIVTVDATTQTITGVFSGLPTSDISYWDVKYHNGELLVSNSDTGNDAIERYGLDGTFLGYFAQSDGSTSFDFIQQIAIRDNGNILGGGFSPPSGVYEFMPDGTSLGVVAADGFGPRGAHEMPDGDVLWSNGNFLKTDTKDILTGGSYRFITPTSVPEPSMLALVALVPLVWRRR